MIQPSTCLAVYQVRGKADRTARYAEEVRCQHIKWDRMDRPTILATQPASTVESPSGKVAVSLSGSYGISALLVQTAI